MHVATEYAAGHASEATDDASTGARVHRRASDEALQHAAEKIRSSFLQVARRELVADGVVITAMSEALAAVEAALARAPRAAA